MALAILSHAIEVGSLTNPPNMQPTNDPFSTRHFGFLLPFFGVLEIRKFSKGYSNVGRGDRKKNSGFVRDPEKGGFCDMVLIPCLPATVKTVSFSLRLARYKYTSISHPSHWRSLPLLCYELLTFYHHDYVCLSHVFFLTLNFQFRQ